MNGKYVDEKWLKIFIIRKIKIKITIKYHYTPTRMSKIQQWSIPNITEDVEELELSFAASRNV